MTKFNAIKLPNDFDIYREVTGEKIEILEPISKINIFVGANNTGKSRFMRILSKQKKIEILKASFNIEEVRNSLKEIVESVETADRNVALSARHGFDRKSIEDAHLLIPNGIKTIDNLATLQGILNTWSGYSVPPYTHDHVISACNSVRRKAKEGSNLIQSLPTYADEMSPNRVYIPTLRGLRPITDSTEDFYANRTINDYFPNSGDSSSAPEVFTGWTFYRRLTELLLGNNKERKLIVDYQKFISRALFEDKPIALIPNQKEKVVVVKIGEEKEQPIHHLGDGIQSAIILSFLPFVMQEQTFFFIEEPEMYMHPGLQRKMLNFFASSKRPHLVFLTTHSNHFLDITIDVKDASIFTFRKIFGDSEEDELTPNFTIEAVDSGQESSLELLGVRNSSVFLVNATIWVEGITDRWYLRKMLNSYMDYLEETDELTMNLEEDTHYSFVEYGGANITHWSFLDYEEHPIEVERLCAKAIVIIDGDGEKKMKRKEDLERILGDRLIILPCREVENLLPYPVIKEVVEEYEKDNELALKEYDYEKYKDVPLGRFVEDTMLKKNTSRKGGYKADSGTLKDKVGFCEKALDKIKFEDLEAANQEIIKGIYQFIVKQNS